MVPKGWNVRPLADIAKVTSGGTPSRTKPEYWLNGTVPWIRTTEVQNCVLTPEDTQEYISELGLKNSSAKIVPAGTVVLAMIGQGKTRGQVALLKFEATTNQNCAAIIFKNDQEPAFHFNFLLSQYENIRAMSNSAGQSNLSGALVKSIRVPVPPLPEQKKIAQILSTWDKAITTTEQLLANSQQQKKALMQQLLTGKKRLLDENGVRFSGEWSKVHLKDSAECLDNRRVPLNAEERSKMQGNIPYWGANGVVDYVNKFIFNETIVLLAEDGGYFDEYATRPIANLSYGKSWVNNHAHILRAKANCSNEWLYYSLVHKNILGFVNGGTRAKLNKKDMLMIGLLLPPLEEQKKIVDVLSCADLEINNLENKLEALKQEKKALMQQLLTGKRRVKVDEEAA